MPRALKENKPLPRSVPIKPCRMPPVNATLRDQLRRALQLADKLFAERVGEIMTPTQFLIMRAIKQADLGGGAIQRDLIAATGIDRSTLSDSLRRLEAEKLVRPYTPRQDARARFMSLTPKGAAKLEEAEKKAKLAEKEFRRRLPSPNDALLASFLQTLVTPVGEGEAA